MKLEKGVISNRQLMLLIFSFMEFMVMSINFVYSVSRESTWIAVLAAYPLAMLAVVGYTAIARSYPGKNLVQIDNEVMGPYIGRLVSFLYIWFFFEYMIHFAYYFNSFWITYIMTETPRAAFIIMIMVVCAMAVRRGIETIARCAAILGILVTLMVLLSSVLLLGDTQAKHLLPMLEISPRDFIQSVHIILTIPFCDVIAFLMIVPYTDDKKNIRKPMLVAMSMSTALLLVIVIVSTAVLGVRMSTSTSATFAITREIEIAEILTRLDVLVAITLLITVFMKITVFYYATVLGLAQMMDLRSYKPLVIPVAIAAIVVSIKLYPSDMEQVYCAQYVWPFNAAFYEFILPAITLAVIGIRSLVKAGKENAQ